MKSAIDKINKICADILTLTDEELDEVLKMAKGQMEYFSPLKNATMGWQHKLGQHNMEVVNELRHLRDTIKEGEDIEPPHGC